MVYDGLDTTIAGVAMTHSGGDEAALAELDFLGNLAERTVVSNAEGVYALMLYVEAEGPLDEHSTSPHTSGTNIPSNPDTASHSRQVVSYADRIAEARRRGWVAHNWDEPGDLAMQRGTLARAMAEICKVRGGVMMRLTGSTARYATRELAYLGILSPGSEQQTMTGGEFTSILSKAQDYQLLESARAGKPAAHSPRATRNAD